MNPLKIHVIEKILSYGGSILVENSDSAIQTLNKLGIQNDCEFYEVYSKYRPSLLKSNTKTELVDAEDDVEPNLIDCTNFARDIYNCPDNFVCMNSGSVPFFLYK